jgi:histidyl-tRNA synthetase
MTQALSTQPYKGTRDFYPEDMRIRNWMFDRLRQAVGRFGYLEYDGPMLEPFDLYAAKSGEELVNQQLYWLVDKGERKLAVRPEMTPTFARMVAAKVNELPKPVRWFAIPNLWRYERPQRGRLREHWQLNVDVVGGDPLLADAEILTVALDLMRAFGGEQHVSIKVNNRRLMDHFFKNVLQMTPESALATTKAIDARAKIGEDAYAKWLGELGVTDDQRSKMEGFFSASFDEVATLYPCAGTEELSRLFALMKESGAGNQVVFDATVMRGLDYYTGTVFEIYDVSPENRRALFGGGRYDDLLGLFGKTKAPGVGFGMGDVGLQNFLEVHGLLPKFEGMVDVFVSLPKIELRSHAERVARDLREFGLKVVTPLEVGGFGAQLKLAAKHGARFAVLFGDEELNEGKVLVKDLKSGEQASVDMRAVGMHVRTYLTH